MALLVVILGTSHTPAAALDNFRHLWWYAASMAVVSGLACSFLRAAQATAPRPAEADQVVASSRAALIPMAVSMKDDTDEEYAGA